MCEPVTNATLPIQLQDDQQSQTTPTFIFSNINVDKKVFHEGCGALSGQRENPFDEKESIIISRPQEFKEKIQKMKRDGISEMQIVSDFDQTITGFNSRNVIQKATLGIIRQSPVLSNEFTGYLESLFEKYHPIEVDPKLTQEVKAKCVEEWNRLVGEAYVKEGLHKQNVYDSLEKSNSSLRHHFGEFLKKLAGVNMPFYIVSGGVSLYLKCLLDQITDINEYPNFFMFSNEGHFDPQTNTLSRFDMNVNSSLKSTILTKDQFSFTKNALLFGDFPHDILMKDNMGCETVVSIFFLRDSKEAEIEDLKKNWDIIIRGDGSFILPHAIIHAIAGDEHSTLSFSNDSKKSFIENPIYAEANTYLEIKE